MSYIRVCSSYETNDHKVHIKPEPDSSDDYFIQKKYIQKIVRRECTGITIQNAYDVMFCHNNGKKCGHEFYLCRIKKQKRWTLVHPESFPIIRRLIDPNHNPNEGIEKIINDYLIDNPLSETILGLLLPGDDYIKPNKKRKI